MGSNWPVKKLKLEGKPLMGKFIAVLTIIFHDNVLAYRKSHGTDTALLRPRTSLNFVVKTQRSP